MGLDTGSRIAQYRLERKLGAGGMGEVYLARDEKLDRFVAIKLLTAADDGARRRLAREARAAASLDHPGICAVYEVGTDPGAGDFIAMQYIEGETLAARLRRGRMSPDESMGIAAQIAESLVAAHKHGLVHRDLKPQNIIITPAGSARLLDFGLALHVPSTTEAANAITSSRVTDPNMVLGTPSYMSPEQVRNEPADFRSDVFSLGCVVYECLTGTRAFTGATTAEVLGAILHVDPPPVSSVAPNVGPAYDATCARMLDKIPSERFQSAEEALGAIKALTPSRAVSTGARTSASPRGSRTPFYWLLAAVLVFAAAQTAWNWYNRTSLPVPPTDAEGWYIRGVEAMRDGAFLGARDAFKKAIEIFPGYVQAYSRLAEASTAMDDERGALAAMIEAGLLGPNRSRWPEEERLRYEAASAASVRKYANAIAAYKRLADLKPRDAGRWVDLGRAQEASPIIARTIALASYQKASELDPQSAAARLRRGAMLASVNVKESLASIDEAIGLYRTLGRTEGELEALLRKAAILADTRQPDDPRQGDAARAAFEEVIKRSPIDRFPSQNIRAQFLMAKLEYVDGHFSEAEELARRAVKAADDAALPLLSANGLIELGNPLIALGRHDEADAQYITAITIAKDRAATRLEMRGKLNRAGLKLIQGKNEEAVPLASEALKYFASTEDARLLSDSKNQLARAYEYTNRYTEARTLVEEALKYAESSNDARALANALEGLAGIHTATGNYPEALKYRRRLADLDKNVASALPKHITNTADLLVLLGRYPEAKPLLAEMDRGIASKLEAYVRRHPRIEQIRTLQAAIERRWPDVVSGAANVERVAPPRPPGAKIPDAVILARVLAEYAKAQLGKSGMSVEDLVRLVLPLSTAADKREATYWIALTLLIRGETARAESLAIDALAESGVRDNAEQGWRLAAVATMAARQRSAEPPAALAGRKNSTPAELEASWGAAATQYFARPDLIALRKGVR